MSADARRELIGELERELGRPVVVIAASWRPDIAVDLAEAGARTYLELVHELEDSPAVVLIGRGGRNAFTDTAWRASLNVGDGGYAAIVPYLCNGWATCLALGAKTLFMGPFGALGAYDAGPVGELAGRLSYATFDDVPALGGIHQEHDPALAGRLAAGLQERRLAAALMRRILASRETKPDDELASALSAHALGREGGLHAAELEGLGLELAPMPGHAWKLFLTYEDALGLRGAPQPRYTESDLGDEVEFEPAAGVAGAFIESATRGFVFELDTGRPDADTGRFAGEWLPL